ncbi:hypothetical protein KAR34_01125 [bacterium]|nr:hypothetical protein [bacterium]
MKRVFVFGAGASRDLNFTSSVWDYPQPIDIQNHVLQGPLSSGFFYTANEFNRIISNRYPLIVPPEIGNRLGAYIQRQYNIKKNELLNDQSQSKKINIEGLYTELEQARESRLIKNGEIDLNTPEYETYTALGELKKYIFATFAFMSYYCVSQLHQRFAKEILKPGDTIISFNWEILLEEALDRTDLWKFEDGYGFRFRGLVGKVNRPEQENGSQITVLKPHGSINWYRDDKSNRYLALQTNVGLRGGAPGGWLNESYKVDCNNSVKTAFIPPGKKREDFPDIWGWMDNELEQADEICLVGFSFNKFDKHITDRFEKKKYRKNPKIEIINPDTELIIKCKKIFKVKNVTRPACSFANWFENHLVKK